MIPTKLFSNHPKARQQHGGVMGFLLGLLLLAALAFAGAVFWWVHQPLRMHGDDIELAIESGTTPREIARGWVDAGVDA